MTAVLDIYSHARGFMAENGNPDQWGRSGYPSEELLLKDIRARRLYVIRASGRCVASFVFITGNEPTYTIIENGAWLDDAPYGTIHRLASYSEGRGAARACIDFCKSRCKELGIGLRADTHEANLPMQHILESAGFVRCGTIHVADGTPRIAYQLP